MRIRTMRQDELRQLPIRFLHLFDGRLQRTQLKDLRLGDGEPAKDSRQLVRRRQDRPLQPQSGEGVVRVTISSMERAREAELLDSVDSIKAQDLLAHRLVPESLLILAIYDGIHLIKAPK